MAKILLGHDRTGMKRTRDEVASLLRRSEKNLRESQQIYERLRALVHRIDQALAGKVAVKRKAGK